MVANQKPRFISFGVSLVGAIAAVVIAAWFFRSPIPSIDAVQAEELCAAADHLSEWQEGDVQKSGWPEAIVRLAPKSVRVTDIGVYLELERFFVTEHGLFVLPSTSSYRPTPGGDPSYRLLRERVYWYEIKG